MLTETSAVTHALNQAPLGLVDDRIRRCVRQVATQGTDAAEMVTDAPRVVARLIRS